MLVRILSRNEKEDSGLEREDAGRESDESGLVGILVCCLSRIEPIEFLLTRGETSPVFPGGVVFFAKLDAVSRVTKLDRRGVGVVVFFESDDEVEDSKLGILFSLCFNPPLFLEPAAVFGLAL